MAVATLALVGGGSAYRIASLSGGGHTVAELLGGRPIDPNTTDPDERRLLNVVEEMAIASGTPVPPVYLLEDEEGINAFAAGYTPVRRRDRRHPRVRPESLTRDELQGVIAHEFSHILNGDMRLNIRLMGVALRHPADQHHRLDPLPDHERLGSSRGATRTRRKGAIPCPSSAWPCTSSATSGSSSARLIKAAVSPPARVPGRRLGGPVHPQPRGDRRGPEEDRGLWRTGRRSGTPRPRRSATCSSARPSACPPRT